MSDGPRTGPDAPPPTLPPARPPGVPLELPAAEEPALAAADRASRPGLRASAIRGVLWTGGGKTIERFLALGTFVLLGRLLDPSAFGTVALASACVGIVQVLADLGFSTWLVQATRVTATEASTAFWTATVFGALTGAGLFLSAGLVASGFDSPALEPALQWLSLSLLVTGLSSTPAALLARDLRFKELALRQLVAAVAGAAAGVGLALAGAGVMALVAQLLVHQVVALVTLYALVRWRPSLVWSGAVAGEITRFGTKMVGIQGLQQLRDRGEPLLIGAILGATALGFWVVAARVLQVVLDLGLTVVSQVAGPTFAKLKHEPELLARAYERCLTVCSLLVGPALVGLAVTSTMLVPLVFGEKWQASAPLATLLAVGGLVRAMTFFDRPVLVARGRLGVELALVTFVVLLQLGLILAVGPLGLLPLAVAAAARPYVVWPLRAIVLRRTVSMPLSVQRRPVVVLASCAAAGGITVAVAQALGLYEGGWLRLAGLSLTYLVVLAAVLALTARHIVRDAARQVSRRPARAGVAAPA